MKNYVSLFFAAIVAFFVSVKNTTDSVFALADSKIKQAHTVADDVASKGDAAIKKAVKFKSKASAVIWGIYVFLRTVTKLFIGILLVFWKFIVAIARFIYKRGKAVGIALALMVIAIVFGKLKLGSSATKAEVADAAKKLKSEADTVKADIETATTDVETAAADVKKTGDKLDAIADAATKEQTALADAAGFKKA